MPSTESQSTRAPASWLLKPLRWLLTGLAFLCRAALVGWATLAIYYSNLPWAWLRLVLAVAFLVFGIWVLWRARTPPRLFFFCSPSLCALVCWFAALHPHHPPQRHA